MSGQAGKANALIREKSPYLLQHAFNPVDWRAWDEQAFRQAAALDKPVFASIGYATCHWCHVMERECFQDEETARVLNDTFVCIKVDKEERPDLDAVYMLACQAMTGSGGWPLNVVMTPAGLPFFSATYIPKHSAFGRIGLLELASRIGEIWKTRRSDAEGIGAEVAEAMRRSQAVSLGEIGPGAAKSARDNLAARFDRVNGGFGGAPKFPTPHNLLFLLDSCKRENDPQARAMAETTLTAMRRGGIFDQIGYGFHRYSTDELWLLPHFEKMLYDQALLALASLAAFEAGGDPFFARLAREILTYVRRDLTAPDGGFACGEDADSEGVEGRFYVFTTREIDALLPPLEAKICRAAYGMRDPGNFNDEATGRPTGENVLHLAGGDADTAAALGISPEAFGQGLERANAILFAAREKRVRPLKDDKVLADWNGLAVAALARAGRTLGDGELTRAAADTARFILSRLSDGPDGLLHRYRDGEAAIPAFLDDYAFFTWGLVELHAADGNQEWLDTAVRLTDACVERFWDEQNGGFFATSNQAGKLILRPKDAQDMALPSGNSVSLLNLRRLHRLTGRADFKTRAEALTRAFGGLVNAMPAGFTFMLYASQTMD